MRHQSSDTLLEEHLPTAIFIAILSACVLYLAWNAYYGLVILIRMLLKVHMDIYGFVALMAICLTVIGVTAVIGVTIYKLKLLSINAKRQEKRDELDREIAMHQIRSGR